MRLALFFSLNQPSRYLTKTKTKTKTSHKRVQVRIYLEAGTHTLSFLHPGDSIELLGPGITPTNIETQKKMVCNTTCCTCQYNVVVRSWAYLLGVLGWLLTRKVHNAVLNWVMTMAQCQRPVAFWMRPPGCQILTKRVVILTTKLLK